MMNKKAQSAMEYLMTYGWAILVVLIALGALFYLGVFSPRTPNTCTATAPAVCTDVKVKAATTDSVVISAGASGVSYAYIDLTVAQTAFTALGYGTCTNSTTTYLSTTTPTAIKWSCANAPSTGSKFSGSFTIKYMLTGSTTEHTTTIQISGTVET